MYCGVRYEITAHAGWDQEWGQLGLQKMPSPATFHTSTMVVTLQNHSGAYHNILHV